MKMSQRTLLFVFLAGAAELISGDANVQGDERRSRRVAPPQVIEFEPVLETRSAGDGIYETEVKTSIFDSEHATPAHEGRGEMNDRPSSAPHDQESRTRVSTSIDSTFEFGMVVVLLIIGLVIGLMKWRL